MYLHFRIVNFGYPKHPIRIVILDSAAFNLRQVSTPDNILSVDINRIVDPFFVKRVAFAVFNKYNMTSTKAFQHFEYLISQRCTRLSAIPMH